VLREERVKFLSRSYSQWPTDKILDVAGMALVVTSNVWLIYGFRYLSNFRLLLVFDTCAH